MGAEAWGHSAADLLKELAKKHDILFFPYVTMCDEGWFPRFKFLSNSVEKYYDSTLLSNYSVRYNLFIMVVVCTGIIAIVVPFVLR